MAKFKIGDKVRCIDSISEKIGGPQKGQEFIVTAVDNAGCSYIGFKIDTYTKNPKIQSGKYANWGASCFELLEQSTTKHYKWNITIQFQDILGGITIISEKTPHYVSEKRIQDYIMFRINQHDGKCINSSYFRLDHDFVEDIE